MCRLRYEISHRNLDRFSYEFPYGNLQQGSQPLQRLLVVQSVLVEKARSTTFDVNKPGFHRKGMAG